MNLQEALEFKIEYQPAKEVLIVLTLMSKGSDRCSLSLEDIAAHTGLLEQTIRRAIVELERLNLVNVSRFQGRGKIPEFSLKGIKRRNKRYQAFPKEIKDMDKTFPYRDDGQPLRDTISGKTRHLRETNSRLKVVVRRKVVRDAYVTFLSMLDDGQFVTAAALAKERDAHDDGAE